MIRLFQTFFSGLIATGLHLYQLLVQLGHHLFLTLVSVPYLFWHSLKPNKRYPGQAFSWAARKVFEHKKAKQAIGVHLLIGLFVFGWWQLPILEVQAYDTQSVLETNPEKIVLTISPVAQTVTEATFQDPVTGYISQSFSWYHPGIDIAGNDFQEIKPIASGTVSLIEDSWGGYGRSVMVDHGNNYMSRYAHLYTVNVTLGQYISHDTVLGTVGATGWATGPHLHLEIYDQGQTVNPLAIIPDRYSREYLNLAASQPATVSATIIAGSNTGGGLFPTAVASTSATFVAKQVLDGFVEPQAYGGVTLSATPTTVTLP